MELLPISRDRDGGTVTLGQLAGHELFALRRAERHPHYRRIVRSAETHESPHGESVQKSGRESHGEHHRVARLRGGGGLGARLVRRIEQLDARVTDMLQTNTGVLAQRAEEQPPKPRRRVSRESVPVRFLPEDLRQRVGTVSPAKASLPASASYKQHSNAQTSVRGSRLLPRACSGLM